MNEVIISKDTTLDLSSNSKNIKYIINDNCKLYIESINEKKRDIKYEFILGDNSYLEINKFNKNNNTELVSIYLNGIKSEFKYNFSTLLDCDSKYIINIYHNNKETISNVINRGVVTNNSSLYIEVNAYVKKGSINSYLNQDSKIVTLEENNSIIKPNLYVDEYLVKARHGASIGNFNSDQLFYLRSRGINEEESKKLLTKGFLLSHLNINKEIL